MPYPLPSDCYLYSLETFSSIHSFLYLPGDSPFFRQRDCPLCKPTEQCSLNYFASAWAAMENILLAATAEGLACTFRIPIGNEPAHVKRLVKAPEEYEFTCFLAIGYPATDAHICTQKQIRVENRIHYNVW